MCVTLDAVFKSMMIPFTLLQSIRKAALVQGNIPPQHLLQQHAHAIIMTASGMTNQHDEVTAINKLPALPAACAWSTNNSMQQAAGTPSLIGWFWLNSKPSTCLMF